MVTNMETEHATTLFYDEYQYRIMMRHPSITYLPLYGKNADKALNIILEETRALAEYTPPSDHTQKYDIVNNQLYDIQSLTYRKEQNEESVLLIEAMLTIREKFKQPDGTLSVKFRRDNRSLSIFCKSYADVQMIEKTLTPMNTKTHHCTTITKREVVQTHKGVMIFKRKPKYDSRIYLRNGAKCSDNAELSKFRELLSNSLVSPSSSLVKTFDRRYNPMYWDSHFFDYNESDIDAKNHVMIMQLTCDHLLGKHFSLVQIDDNGQVIEREIEEDTTDSTD